MYFIFLLICVACNLEIVISGCDYEDFQCHSSTSCIRKYKVCNGNRDCGYYENTDEPPQCKCQGGIRLICNGYVLCSSYNTICDGHPECGNHTSSKDEINCDVTSIADFSNETRQCVQWFLDRRSNSTVNKWGHQVHRTAVALYLADKNFFAPENRTGEEIKYELTIHLLAILNRRKVIKTEQLALYVHAMVVSCLNPRDFYGHDLVAQLRKRVNFSNNTNPLAILVLCNAGAEMTVEDVEQLNETFYLKHRPYWTDTQVMSTMALSCIYSKTNVSVDFEVLNEWVLTMKNPPVGTIRNPRTTALVIQMMLGIKEYVGFDWRTAVKEIQESPFFKSSHFLDKYYLMPVLSNKSPITINASHCPHYSNNTDVFRKLDVKTITVYYSVWMDTKVDFGRSWRLRVPEESTFFDVIAKVQKMDSTHFVQYNIVNGKPYVRSVSGVDEDPDTDHYWFTYERTYASAEDPQRLDKSPKDITTSEDQELILWFKTGVWTVYGASSEETPK